MTEITDEYMGEMLTKSRPFTVVLLKQGPKYGTDGADKVVWEHARRNFALRAEGALAIVGPIRDDSAWCGIGIFTGSPEEVAQLMDDDPGVAAGIFEYEVHPIRSFPGDSLPRED
jgi:hypothetical protein